jgi:glucose-1-phosphate adenylyltransferase
MGIYIFTWKVLKAALLSNAEQSGLDFGKHIIPYCHNAGAALYAYEFSGYWKDVGTLNSYWEANMELIDLVPEFNLYEDYWKIYTRCVSLPPTYTSADSHVERSIIGEGTDIYGTVINSVIGCGVTIGKGTVIRDSIIMNGTKVEDGCNIEKAIIAENSVIGGNVSLGTGDEAENETDPNIYSNGLVTIGEQTRIPEGVSIGKNSVVFGDVTPEDFPDGKLDSGRTLIKVGDRH